MRHITDREEQLLGAWLARRGRQGLTWSALSEASGISIWKLRYWHSRLGPTGTNRRARSKHGFVAVDLPPCDASASGAIEITTPSGFRVRVPRDVESDDLRRMLEALSPEC